MKDKDIPGLLYKHISGTLNAVEQARLEEWKNASSANADLFEEMSSSLKLSEAIAENHPDNKFTLRNRILQRVLDEGEFQFVHRRRFVGRWWMAAASILVIAAVSVWWISNYQPSSEPGKVVSNIVTDVPPGKTGAILTLSNGEQVVLDSLSGGIISNQNGSQVVLQDGGLTYNPDGKNNGELTYNTITTPRGRQFDVKLPDGTRVWLNAASSITYPTVFIGKERVVKATGEVYLEVARSETPFRLNINDEASILVLGTHFNVNAYHNEENISTTLLEGSVRIGPFSADQALVERKSVTLVPGQQARLNSGLNTITVSSGVPIDKVMAWKNGLFDFDGATLGEVMRQLERWYDIEVVYEDKIQQEKLAGKMTRGVSLNGLLKGLDQIGIKSKLEGNVLRLFQ